VEEITACHPAQRRARGGFAYAEAPEYGNDAACRHGDTANFALPGK